MSGVRVLVGTKKGGFVITSDGKRKKWNVSGPHFAGWEIYHMKGSPVDPEPDLCLADQRLVRAGHSALRRRRQNVDHAGQQAGGADDRPTACPRARATSSSTTRRRQTASRSRRTSGTTARSTRGNSSASGTWSRR